MKLVSQVLVLNKVPAMVGWLTSCGLVVGMWYGGIECLLGRMNVFLRHEARVLENCG